MFYNTFLLKYLVMSKLCSTFAPLKLKYKEAVNNMLP